MEVGLEKEGWMSEEVANLEEGLKGLRFLRAPASAVQESSAVGLGCWTKWTNVSGSRGVEAA